MSEWKEYTAKTVEEAVLIAKQETGREISSSDIEILEKESSGFLGLFKNQARIRVKISDAEAGTAQTEAAPAQTQAPAAQSESKSSPKASLSNEESIEIVLDFLRKVFTAMELEAELEANFDEENSTIEVQVKGTDMGILIGKRGQTLDSLQYLASLVVNRVRDGYIKIKLDTENYRERRKETLENLAGNIANKVKRSHKPLALEPMNPYERRIIHSALQNDKYVETHSEGEDPYRKVVVTPKKGVVFNSNRYGSKKPYDRKYGSKGGYGGPKKLTSSKEFHKKYGADTKDYSTDYKKDYAAYLESKAAAKAEAAAKAQEDARDNG
ncbi:MAG: protein jag [Lachnospiraceae bacterium]|nr:protein jag [Lachnospiraceae bacterium]